jgi:pyruvate-formate lyase
MSTEITITLTDETYRQAERFAKLANKDVASVIADTIRLSIPAVRSDVVAESVSDLSDEQVLQLTQLQMEADQDARLSELLDQQQSGCLSSENRLELEALMQIYQEGLLRKATALSEAVKRELLAPLD